MVMVVVAIIMCTRKILVCTQDSCVHAQFLCAGDCAYLFFCVHTTFLCARRFLVCTHIFCVYEPWGSGAHPHRDAGRRCRGQPLFQVEDSHEDAALSSDSPSESEWRAHNPKFGEPAHHPYAPGTACRR